MLFVCTSVSMCILFVGVCACTDDVYILLFPFMSVGLSLSIWSSLYRLFLSLFSLSLLLSFSPSLFVPLAFSLLSIPLFFSYLYIALVALRSSPLCLSPLLSWHSAYFNGIPASAHSSITSNT